MTPGMEWTDRRVLLTGAAGGIGGCLARQLAAAGARLALADRDAGGLQRLREELRDAGGPRGAAHVALPTDLSDPEQACALVARAEAALGGVDVLINNAGLLSFRPLEDERPEDTARLFAVNVVAPVLLSRSVLPGFRRRGAGRIVNIGSIFGSIGFAWFASYSASKFALRGFSEALRRELAGPGIGVTYVAPRATRTPLAATFGRMAAAVKMNLDEPESVARRILRAVERDGKDRYLGFPECVFVRLNALLPRLIDRAVARQDALAEPFARESSALPRPTGAPPTIATTPSEPEPSCTP